LKTEEKGKRSLCEKKKRRRGGKAWKRKEISLGKGLLCLEKGVIFRSKEKKSSPQDRKGTMSKRDLLLGKEESSQRQAQHEKKKTRGQQLQK